MKRYFSIVLAAVLAFGMASCQPEEAAKTPLEAPAEISYVPNMSSITVSWTAVENAGQYYYVIRNAYKYVVASGTTTATTVTATGLKPSSEFIAEVRAIPTVEASAKYSGSEYATAGIKTKDYIPREYEWKMTAEVYFGDDKNFDFKRAKFGLEKGTGKYVVESWCGAEYFDFVFTVDANGYIHPDKDQDICTGTGAQDAVYLNHGLGGTTNSYVTFYETDGYACFTGSETGGNGYAWVYDPNGVWTYWQLYYGDGGVSEEEDDDEWDVVFNEGVTPDAEEDWEAVGTVTYDGTEYSVPISFNAKKHTYTIKGWYGVEDYDIIFTRRATGDWEINQDKSSAVTVPGPDGNGAIGLGHGLTVPAATAANCWFYVTDNYSGFEGDAEHGKLWAWIWDPTPAWAAYELVW